MQQDPNFTDPRLILQSPQDNCLIAAARLETGEDVMIEGQRMALAKTIELGHKVSLLSHPGSELAGAHLIPTRPGASWESHAQPVRANQNAPLP